MKAKNACQRKNVLFCPFLSPHHPIEEPWNPSRCFSATSFLGLEKTFPVVYFRDLSSPFSVIMARASDLSAWAALLFVILLPSHGGTVPRRFKYCGANLIGDLGNATLTFQRAIDDVTDCSLACVKVDCLKVFGFCWSYLVV